MNDLETAVAHHYGRPGLVGRILDSLAAAGIDTEHPSLEDLAPVDEFHIGGRAATTHALAKLAPAADHHVLDIGCGLGGAARYAAASYGCRVTGIDLTADYIEAARVLTERTGLADRVGFEVASALDMPFAEAAFDAAFTFHVAMNIKDRPRLYGETARVLKPGGLLCVYDVMKRGAGEPRFPTPWAQTPETSHLTTPDEMRALLDGAGFTVVEVEDRTEYGIAFFRERLAPAAEPPPVGLHLLLGSGAREKLENVLNSLEDGSIAPVVMIATRR